jgi:hypothetical protein
LYGTNTKKDTFLFSPALSLNYKFNNEKDIRAAYQLRNYFGDITTAYTGAVLQNYRTLQAYTEGIQEEKTHTASISYTHQKSIKLLYSNIGFSYNYTIANTVLSDSFSNNIHHAFFIPYENHRTLFSVNGGISKYLFRLKTKLDFKIRKSWMFSEQFVNNELLHFQSDNFSFNIAADKKLGNSISINYTTNLAWYTTKLTDKTTAIDIPKTKSFYFDQRFNVSFNFLKYFYVETAGRHRSNEWSTLSNTNYFFLDATLKRTNILKGLDMEWNCSNLFNTKDYITYYQNQNQISSAGYHTKGIMLFLQLKYWY